MKNILVIDDSKAVHAYITTCFKPFQVTLTHVFNGQEALTKLKETTAFDVILLDWEMPILNGPSTFDSMPCKGVVPVVMMTTKNAPDDIALMLDKGVSEYILKPFTGDILLEKLEIVLGQGFKHAA